MPLGRTDAGTTSHSLSLSLFLFFSSVFSSSVFFNIHRVLVVTWYFKNHYVNECLSKVFTHVQSLVTGEQPLGAAPRLSGRGCSVSE